MIERPLHQAPHAAPHAAPHGAAPYRTPGPDWDAGTYRSLHLAARLVIGIAAGGALAGILLYRSRPQPPKAWYRAVRDEVAEQLAHQVKQVRQVAAAVASEIERG